MNTTSTTIHETHARLRKAIALVDVLDAAGAGDEPITDVQWRLAERAARVRPSSTKTRETVLIMLTERRRLRGTDHPDSHPAAAPTDGGRDGGTT